MKTTKLLKIVCLASLWLCTSAPAQGQSSPAVLSARAFALGDAGAAFEDIHSAFSNQAGLVHLETSSALASVSRRFNLSELTQVSVAFAAPTADHGVFFASVQSFGFSAYRQSVLGGGYVRRLTDDLSIAAELSLFQFKIERYGNVLAPGYTLALQQRVTPVLVLGLQVVNPVPFPAPRDIDLPSSMRLGLAYSPSDAVAIYADVDKDADFDPRFKLGVEYALHPAFALRFGGSSGPGMFHGGVGYAFADGLRIDLAAAYHQQLGLTPALSISYQSGR